MKRYLMMLSGFTGVLFLLTIVPARLTGQLSDGKAQPSAATKTTRLSTEAASADRTESYAMLDITSGKVTEISARDYIIGAVCAEMPATFEPEALKAQAVAAHTYAERQQLLEQQTPTPALCGADFSNDSSQYQAYFTENQARQYYGDSFEASYAKISDAVDAVLPYILEYDGAPIIAAFCSMSAGTTESAETVWGSKVEYLIPVESSADTTAPRYLETTELTKEAFQEAVSKEIPHVVWDENPEKWVQISSATESGTVCTAVIGGQECTGQEIRAMLGLRSAAFTVETDGETLVFTTRGYGHGVGMSQFGANAMAKDGADWQEILAHYYPNTVVERE